MVRFVIIGVILAVAFILYALVDAAMSDPARSRGVSKPVWVVIVVVLPVVGAILWFAIGRGRGPVPAPERAPDDDPSFGNNSGYSKAEIDAHVEELEARLRELDEEQFPEADEKKSDRDDSIRGKEADGEATGEASGEQR